MGAEGTGSDCGCFSFFSFFFVFRSPVALSSPTTYVKVRQLKYHQTSDRRGMYPRTDHDARWHAPCMHAYCLDTAGGTGVGLCGHLCEGFVASAGRAPDVRLLACPPGGESPQHERARAMPRRRGAARPGVCARGACVCEACIMECLHALCHVYFVGTVDSAGRWGAVERLEKWQVMRHANYRLSLFHKPAARSYHTRVRVKLVYEALCFHGMCYGMLAPEVTRKTVSAAP